MREIKFRGKDLDTNQWVYGDLLCAIDYDPDTKKGVFTKGYIIHEKGDEDSVFVCRSVDIDPDTIGEFTSLYDRNKKEIYEGDLLKFWDDDTGLIEVRFVRGVFAFLWQGNLDDEMPINAPTHEWATIVGNIHDNPELLKGGEK